MTKEKYFDGEQELILYVYNGGNKYYYNSENQCHRLDGPAIEILNGYKEWWYENKKINCSSQEEFERYLKLQLLWG